MKEREIWLCMKDDEAFQDRKDKHLSGKASIPGPALPISTSLPQQVEGLELVSRGAL